MAVPDRPPGPRTALVLLLLVPGLAATPPGTGGPGRTAVGKQAMVATAHPLATRAALEVLQKGGNAVDAAVAAAFTVGVVEPDASGLGGGGGMLIRLRSGKAVYVNYYGHAPGKIGEAAYDDAKDGKSAKAVLVPGNVAGLALALRDYGTLPLAAVLGPAIRHAEQGFVIDETLSKVILDNAGLLQGHPATAAVYLRDGFPLQEGETLTQPELAATLKAIAKGGPRAFYEGPLAREMVDVVTKAGGVLSLDDLRTYAPIVGEPVSGTYRGHQVLSSALPHSGTIVVEALNILENADLVKLGHYSTSADAFHLMAEAMRRAYADRMAFLADPRFEEVPGPGLLSKEFARSRYQDIDRTRVVPADYRKTPAGDPARFAPGKGAAEPAPEGATAGHTTQISVLDRKGNAVSLTQTMGTFFGSAVTAAGVLYNNGVNNFATVSRRNRIEPGKQPRSFISPTVVVKAGKPFLVLGSPGATRIIATVVTLLVNVLDYGMTPEQANAAPRFLCQKSDPVLSLESRFPKDVQDEMTRRGHALLLYGDLDLFFGGSQIILADPVRRVIQGSADPRRGGAAMGY